MQHKIFTFFWIGTLNQNPRNNCTKNTCERIQKWPDKFSFFLSCLKKNINEIFFFKYKILY